MFRKSFLNAFRRKSTDFVRQRCLTFPVVVTLLIRGVLASVNRELADVFDELAGGRFAGRPPSAAAFCKARKKIKPGAFRDLIKQVSRHFFHLMEKESEARVYRLIAIDGSILNLPDTQAIRRVFGPRVKQTGLEGPPQARLSVCYELEYNVALDARLTSRRTGERKLAKRHFRLLRPGDLVVMDMGYFGQDMLFTLLGSELEFVMRVPPAYSKQIEQFVASGKASDILSVVEGNRHDRVRAVRIELDDGTIEVLLTNLTSRTYDLDFFRHIYHRRWGIETFFGHLKSAYEVENLSGRCPNKIKQEVYAKIFACSLASMLTASLRPALRRATRGCKHVYQFATSDVLAATRRALTALLIGPTEQLQDVCRQLARRLLSCRSPVRPGRSFPRKFKLRPQRHLPNRKRI